MPATFARPDLSERHPCFAPPRHAGPARAGRLHLPVSPACNITCTFCARGVDPTAARPGVARRLLRPQEALTITERALRLCPEISVVGIAGPGDTLATDHALDTFRLIHAAFPSLILCLSTNGLRLPERLDALVATGVQTLTVTVNAVDPVLQARISPVIAWQGRRVEGLAAAEILIASQLEGIRRAHDQGVSVKVNTVLIPGLNDRHVEAIAQAVAAAGASLFNIIPLIPQHGLADVPAPTPAQVARARLEAGTHLSVFSHCQRCRADAAGIPGVTDIAERLYDRRLDAETFSHG
ncbi:radical SAM protein [Pararhodospirillum photometricum]|uniref:FeMo cofactor biosynthesis protein NifB n=1 Tax=Pararhodospirillum photometricum DSM 122 TaxID=1150469 RepID=H6SR43_PARPM|nr:radical SAM protein [Pararhodospirillum photometricum]CCG09765.1 Radical SAM [Pararhodospirillum photometricum DSM 122]